MPRLRSLSQMNFPWLYDKNKLLIWHNFLQRLEKHLQDTEALDTFYFELLLSAAKKWDKQNPKRIICESYIALLDYEGRLPPLEQCTICESPIQSDIALMQSFKPAHSTCIYAATISKTKLQNYFETKKTIVLENNEIEYLYEVIMKGF